MHQSHLAQAIQAVLAADATLAGLLAVYQGAPAIFLADDVPPDAKEPWAHIRGPMASGAWNTFRRAGAVVVWDIAVFFPADGTRHAADTAAERVRALLDDRQLAPAGQSVVQCKASVPIAAPREAGVVGRIVTLTLTIQAL